MCTHFKILRRCILVEDREGKDKRVDGEERRPDVDTYNGKRDNNNKEVEQEIHYTFKGKIDLRCRKLRQNVRNTTDKEAIKACIIVDDCTRRT